MHVCKIHVAATWCHACSEQASCTHGGSHLNFTVVWALFYTPCATRRAHATKGGGGVRRVSMSILRCFVSLHHASPLKHATTVGPALLPSAICHIFIIFHHLALVYHHNLVRPDPLFSTISNPYVCLCVIKPYLKFENTVNALIYIVSIVNSSRLRNCW